MLAEQTRVDKYPQIDSDPMQLQSWADQFNIALDETGLVLPPLDDSIEGKICPSLEILKQEIVKRRSKGDHVILLPGGYDLVHIGHASFVVQAIDHYLAINSHLNRDQLFVVALVDDDDLISESKASAYIKAIGKKGPIERGELNIRHPRLRAMASLPLDAVAALPAPTRDINHPLHLNLDSAQFKEDPSLTELALLNFSLAERLHRAIEQLPKIRERITAGVGLLFDPEYWSLESWQLYMLSWLNEDNGKISDNMGPIVRLVSEAEEKYRDIVATIMDMCQIGVEVFPDEHCVSTKELVERHGVEELLNRKKIVYDL
jgi:hypothetical protein